MPKILRASLGFILKNIDPRLVLSEANASSIKRNEKCILPLLQLGIRLNTCRGRFCKALVGVGPCHILLMAQDVAIHLGLKLFNLLRDKLQILPGRRELHGNASLALLRGRLSNLVFKLLREHLRLGHLVDKASSFFLVAEYLLCPGRRRRPIRTIPLIYRYLTLQFIDRFKQKGVLPNHAKTNNVLKRNRS